MPEIERVAVEVGNLFKNNRQRNVGFSHAWARIPNDHGLLVFPHSTIYQRTVRESLWANVN